MSSKAGPIKNLSTMFDDDPEEDDGSEDVVEDESVDESADDHMSDEIDESDDEDYTEEESNGEEDEDDDNLDGNNDLDVEDFDEKVLWKNEDEKKTWESSLRSRESTYASRYGMSPETARIENVSGRRRKAAVSKASDSSKLLYPLAVLLISILILARNETVLNYLEDFSSSLEITGRDATSNISHTPAPEASPFSLAACHQSIKELVRNRGESTFREKALSVCTQAVEDALEVGSEVEKAMAYARRGDLFSLEENFRKADEDYAASAGLLQSSTDSSTQSLDQQLYGKRKRLEWIRMFVERDSDTIREADPKMGQELVREARLWTEYSVSKNKDVELKNLLSSFKKTAMRPLST